jgi:D-inositol-3-phosphate glycosyltransferase
VATLRLFASIREIAGTSAKQSEAETVNGVITEAITEFGKDFADLVPTCRIWINGNPATMEDAVTAEDEIALLPPVSGGSRRNLIQDQIPDLHNRELHVAIISMHTSPLTQPGQGDSGGMNVYIREVATALAHRGIQCTIYVRKWNPSLPREVHLEPGVEIVYIEAGDYDLAKERLPEIIDQFTMGVEADLRGRKSIDIIHANYWLSGVVGHRLKHKLDIPLVTTFHTLGEAKKETGHPEPEERIISERETIGCSEIIVANSLMEKEQLISLYDAPEDRIHIVPLGVEHALFSPGNQAAARSALGLPNGSILMFVGRLQSLKGVDVAINALAEMKDREATLLIVGGASGPQGESHERRLRELIAELPSSTHVVFVPPQPHHILSTYYRASDIVLVPSRSESFGLVALESAACGTPVVAAAVGGLKDLIDDGHTGILVEGWNPTHYENAVNELLSNPFLSTEIAMNAAEKAKDFSWGQTANDLIEIYASILSTALVDCR